MFSPDFHFSQTESTDFQGYQIAKGETVSQQRATNSPAHSRLAGRGADSRGGLVESRVSGRRKARATQRPAHSAASTKRPAATEASCAAVGEKPAEAAGFFKPYCAAKPGARPAFAISFLDLAVQSAPNLAEKAAQCCVLFTGVSCRKQKKRTRCRRASCAEVRRQRTATETVNAAASQL